MRGTRADRLERLQGLQKRLREIEEIKLADLTTKADALAAEAVALLESLGDHSPLTGLFLQAKADRLRRKEAERAAVLLQAQGVRKRLTQASASEKRLERVAVEARGRQRADDEARSLSEILDAYLSSRGASLE